MNRRHAFAAVVLGSAAVFLTTACGPSGSSSSAPASSATASTATGSAAPSSPASTSDSPAGAGSSAAPNTVVPAAAPAGAKPAAGAPTAAGAKPATGAPTAGSGTTGGAWKPCYRPSGYDHFFKLDSAEVYQGYTTVRVTPETCAVNKNNDEDVVYTPVDAARSFVVGSAASVRVLKDTTTPDSVTPRWLVDNKLVNSPYFYYRVNSQNQITAMQEIYHP